MDIDFQYDVFMSHSAQDKATVRALAERLKQDGIRVWFDEWETRSGHSFQASEIESALDQSRVLVLCMSASAFGAEWAELEDSTFRFRDPLNRNRRFIPLRLDDTPIKASLAQFPFIDWRIENQEQAYKLLLRACRDTEPMSGTVEPSEAGWSHAQPSDVVSDRDTRHEFSKKTKDALARRVGMRCSNPDCRRATSGPQSNPNKAINIGVAAHITAASEGGPRYDSTLSKKERSSILNAIWLCQNCAKLVDNDEARFTVVMLRRWKNGAEDAALDELRIASSRRGGIAATSNDSTDNAARKKLKKAQDLERSGKRSEAREQAVEALELARETSEEEEVVEILLYLTMLSPDRDKRSYFDEVEKQAAKITTPAVEILYLRAKAAMLSQDNSLAAAETLYKEAIEICSTQEDDEKGNLATQACIVRSSYVHLLCNQGRHEEAAPILKACEDYAKEHPEAEDSELLQAALVAGIHYCLDSKDEEGAIARIDELEAAATTIRLADRIGGELINVANQASHREMYGAALRAAEASVRLGHRCDDGESPNFLMGALYTEAMVLAKSGHDEEALVKAQAVVSACRTPEDEIIRQAANQLVAEIRRTSGDSESAVQLARSALAAAAGKPENIAFSKSVLARALNDDGQTEEAFKEAREAWALLERASVPPKAVLEILAQVSNYGSQIGEDVVVQSALEAVASLPDDKDDLKEEKSRIAARADANQKIRARILDISAGSPDNEADLKADFKTLHDANVEVVKPLLDLWGAVPAAAAEIYDFWGRGNFVRLLENARRYPNSFNVTIEVRSLEDVKRAIRLWGLYADFLILLWKGESQSGLAIAPFPEDYEGPGGSGYLVAAGSQLSIEGSSRVWHPAMAQVSSIPGEVASFLASEARPFVEAGRLIVVSAPSVGCVNPGHGPFEQLLAESANAIPSLRWRGYAGVPIGLVPHSPDAPLEVLAELAEIESKRLRRLRLLLIQRSRQLVPDEEPSDNARTLALEIDDALRDLTDKAGAFARRKGLETAAEPVKAGTARFKRDGRPLSGRTPESPFAPLLILQNMGYGWRVDTGAIPKPPARFEPGPDDIIGTWLAPPEAGWAIPLARTIDDSDKADSAEDKP